MAEQTIHPEPPDGHALVWPPRAGDELPVLIWRSDRFAEDLGSPEDRWHTPNSDGPSTTWAEACRVADANECPMSEAVLLVPQSEVDRAVADGGYEQIGEHRIALGSGRCVIHGESYEIPVELDRLRQREGGGGTWT